MKTCTTLFVVIFLSLLTCVTTLGSAQDTSTEARKVMEWVDPQYPALARSMNIRGSVKLEVLVAPNGTVKSVEVKGGHPLLVPSAQLAAQRWRWQPSAHETHQSLEFRFNPQTIYPETRGNFHALLDSPPSIAPSRLLKKPGTLPILGGAALQRCDKWPVPNRGFSRRVYFRQAIRVFQQPDSAKITTSQLSA